MLALFETIWERRNSIFSKLRMSKNCRSITPLHEGLSGQKNPMQFNCGPSCPSMHARQLRIKTKLGTFLYLKYCLQTILSHTIMCAITNGTIAVICDVFSADETGRCMHQMTCAVTSQANIVVNGISIEKSTTSCAWVFLHPTNALLGKKFSPVWANSYQLQSSQSRNMIQPTPYITHQKRHLHGWPTNYSCLPFFNVANIHRTRTKP